MRARFTLAIVTCVALFAVAGCGDDEETTTTTTTTPTATGATGEEATSEDPATEDSAAADGDVTAQLETMLQEEGGFTEEQAECVAPKVSEDIESPEELNTQKGVQALIDASFDAVVECGGPAP
jgi:hypothetical protein